MNLEDIDIKVIPTVSLMKKNEEIRFETKDDGLNVALAIMEDQDVSITNKRYSIMACSNR